MDKLGNFCTQKNLIRADMLGDYHSIEFSLSGRTQTMEVHHITLPFNQQRIALLFKMYGIPQDGLRSIYKGIADGVARHIRVCRELTQAGNQDITHILDAQIEKRGDTTHTYLLMMHRYTPIYSAFRGKAKVNDIMDLAGRMTMILRDIYNDGMGYCHGNIGAESIFVDEATGHYVLGDFRYAVPARETLPEKLIFDKRAFDIERERLTPIGYDMYSLGSLICDLMAGGRRTYYSGMRVLPEAAEATELLHHALMVAFKGEGNDIRFLRKCVYDARRVISKSPVGAVSVFE